MQRYNAETGEPGSRIDVANGVERITLRGDVLWVLTSGPDFLHRYDATRDPAEPAPRSARAPSR